MGTPSLNIGGHDFGKVLKVALYVGVSAILGSLAQQIQVLDFSGTPSAFLSSPCFAEWRWYSP